MAQLSGALAVEPAGRCVRPTTSMTDFAEVTVFVWVIAAVLGGQVLKRLVYHRRANEWFAYKDGAFHGSLVDWKLPSEAHRSVGSFVSGPDGHTVTHHPWGWPAQEVSAVSCAEQQAGGFGVQQRHSLVYDFRQGLLCHWRQGLGDVQHQGAFLSTGAAVCVAALGKRHNSCRACR
ncbi:hypothetical protein COO60DRAFT_1101279 [Scenedesmus sp. NREL 46B-D3]|nr:hypothetical protein COO60DRAFT_1101279 [Scenedesmus sp. NREL 46B-D3]